MCNQKNDKYHVCKSIAATNARITMIEGDFLQESKLMIYFWIQCLLTYMDVDSLSYV